MKIKYSNHFFDIALFQILHQFLSPIAQVLFVTLSAAIFYSRIHAGFGVALFSTLFIYLAFWVAQALFSIVHQFSTRSKTVLTEHVIELENEHLLEQTKFNKSLFYWPGIEKAVSRPGFVAIYVTPQMAHVIPNRFFSSKEERMRFLTMARDKIRSARI
ncbi:YcxB family protein [uncultured Xanthomonas sp.]|uniref:YcxB family protein n=1 Tax=uncultured Xanthomonas sp. TaxID=152831 RepID=UPI0025ECF0D9|nr:YcxB family protein [uncultured Xanthomonas sp.]